MTVRRTTDVRLLRWPQHAEERAWCHDRRIPRILLVEHGHRPPDLVVVYEDWVRPSVPPEDLQIRQQALAGRRRAFNRPEVDLHGSLVYRDRRLSISPTQVDLVSCLVRDFGDIVLRTTLADCLPGGSDAPACRNVLDLHIGRLRRKIAPMGLSIRTVWGCGYLLEADSATFTEAEHGMAIS